MKVVQLKFVALFTCISVLGIHILYSGFLVSSGKDKQSFLNQFSRVWS